MNRSLAAVPLLLATATAVPANDTGVAPDSPEAGSVEAIAAATGDPRFLSPWVAYLPASATVPTPLKLLGHMPGTPGELTHVADINRYFAALDKASDRVMMWNIGKSEEGRDMILVAIADEATIKSLDKYKAMIAQLTDPRKTTEEHRNSLPTFSPA